MIHEKLILTIENINIAGTLHQSLKLIEKASSFNQLSAILKADLSVLHACYSIMDVRVPKRHVFACKNYNQQCE